MISEKELLEAIKECHAQKNPNAGTCLKLASYYTILEHMNKESESQTYSRKAEAKGDVVSRAVSTKDAEKVFELLAELIEAVKVYNPKLYDSFMQRLEAL